MIAIYLTKIIYYKLIKVMINLLNLADVIISIVIYYHNNFKSIILDQGFLFILKFFFSIILFLKYQKEYIDRFLHSNR